jgi:hypothetical protein
MAKFGVLKADALALVGTLRSRIVTREKTALTRRKGMSTTIRFMKVVTSRPDDSSLALL